MAHALVHILGSRAGYTTLDASAGLSAAERSELEVLSFGDATSTEVMDRLETIPSMIGRRLRSGRLAVSRMLGGGSDDAGRPTIEIVSLVIEMADCSALVGALPTLAADARVWRLARASVRGGIQLPGETPAATAIDEDALRVFDGWIAARRQGATAVLADIPTEGLVGMLRALEAEDLSQCRWGIGVLSLSAPVDVCTLAPTTAPIGPRPVLRVSRGGSWLSGMMDVAVSYAAREGRLPPVGLIGSLGTAPSAGRAWDSMPTRERLLGPESRDARSAGESYPESRRTLLPIAAISATCSLLLLAVMIAVYRAGTTERPFERTAVANDSAMDSGLGSVLPNRPDDNAAAPRLPSPNSAPLPGYGDITPTPNPSGVTSGTPDRDGDGVPDEVDQCPDLAYGIPQAFYVDKDGDGLGTGDEKQLCSLPDAKSVTENGERYAAKGGDDCDDNPRLTKRQIFFADTDGDGFGSGSPRAECYEAPVDGRATFDGCKWTLNDDDGCPDNKHRSSQGGCGCDWLGKDADFDRNSVLDCLDDDDEDGTLNRDESAESDRRRVVLAEIVGSVDAQLGIAWASDRLEFARICFEKVLKPAKPKPDLQDPQTPQALANEGYLALCKALEALYVARLKANFGTADHRAGPQPDGLPAAKIMCVAEEKSFEGLFKLMPECETQAQQMLKCNRELKDGPVGPVDLRGKVLKSWNDYYGDRFQREVAEWVLDFLKDGKAAVAEERKRIRHQLRTADCPKRQQEAAP